MRFRNVESGTSEREDRCFRNVENELQHVVVASMDYK
jgi:hypothetical protein